MRDPRLTRKVVVWLAASAAILPAMLFLPAGTLAWWQAWMFLASVLLPVFLLTFYLLRTDPALLARRLQNREREAAQKKIVAAGYFPFLLGLLLPGLDRRFGWSDLHAGVSVAADVLVLLGYGIVALVFRTNSYASRIIEVQEGQTVITTGPYAVVRHPMYAGALLLYLSSPLALGSLWGVIPALFVIPVLVARILNEERVLVSGLPGYEEYRRATRYRLVPGIW